MKKISKSAWCRVLVRVESDWWEEWMEEAFDRLWSKISGGSVWGHGVVHSPAPDGDPTTWIGWDCTGDTVQSSINEATTVLQDLIEEVSVHDGDCDGNCAGYDEGTIEVEVWRLVGRERHAKREVLDRLAAIPTDKVSS